jgi:hypothetical protein
MLDLMEALEYQIPRPPMTPGMSGGFDIFPVFFPVSRENETGERFAENCEHRHRVHKINSLRERVRVYADFPHRSV